MRGVHKAAATAFASLIIVLGTSLALAQFGPIKLGVDLPGKKSDAAPAAAAGGAKAYSAPQTFKSPKGFSYTIPAGWQLQSGDPAKDDNVSFWKQSAGTSFQYHSTAMSPSFPKAASVSANLKTCKDDIKLGKLEACKARNEGDQKKKCGLLGWEILQSQKGADGGFQRIIFQGYDGENTYYNFNASAEMGAKFDAARTELTSIIDSIKFCQ
jgi:hypothetical protein